MSNSFYICLTKNIQNINILKFDIYLILSGEHNWLVIRNNSPGFGWEDLYSGEIVLLRLKIKFYTIKSYKEQPRVRFNIELCCCSLLWHETLAVSSNLHCYFIYTFFYILTSKSLCYCKIGAMTASNVCMSIKNLLWFFFFSMYPCHISLSKRLIRIFENLFKFKPPSEDFYRGA